MREGVFRRVDLDRDALSRLGSLIYYLATEPFRRRAMAGGRLPPMPDFAQFLRYPRGADARGLRPDRPLPHPPPQRSARMKARAWAVLVSLPSASAAGSGCRKAADPNEIVAAGHVEATEVRISTKVAGTLLHLNVDEGAAVAAGQELARVDTTDTELELATARADRAQAAAELQLRRAGSREEDVREAEAQVTRAQADLSGAARDLERMEGLLASGSGTTQARDDARTRNDVARASLDAARERLKRLKAGYRREEIDAPRRACRPPTRASGSSSSSGRTR
jgi:multidrug resistance efflux pump